MKKLLVMLIVALLCASVPALAVDLTSLTDDELIRLRADLADELLSRGLMASANVPTGEYIIGEDIPAGTYSVTTEKGVVLISSDDYSLVYSVDPDAPIGKVTFESGMKLQFTGPVTLTKYAGLSFE
jgi:hypothetical protein